MFKGWCLAPQADFRGSPGLENAHRTCSAVVSGTQACADPRWGRAPSSRPCTSQSSLPPLDSVQIAASLTVGKKAGIFFFLKKCSNACTFEEGPRQNSSFKSDKKMDSEWSIVMSIFQPLRRLVRIKVSLGHIAYPYPTHTPQNRKKKIEEGEAKKEKVWL